MAKRIYVGNLSFQTTEADVSEMFGTVGQVESVQIITDRDTGRSKGFGFVQMTDDAAAEKARLCATCSFPSFISSRPLSGSLGPEVCAPA
jgi:RNA recognition motif-containing protein